MKKNIAFYGGTGMAKSKLEQLLANRVFMSKKQKLLCDYVEDNLQEASILTAHQLAEKAGVGTATVFRFLKDFGFSSYGEFRTEIHKYAIELNRSSYWQMKASLQNQDGNEDILYRHIMETTILMQDCMNPTLSSKLTDATAQLVQASSVGILGLRSSKSVALYMYALLIPFLGNLQQFSYDEHFVFEQIRNLPVNSVLFVISGWPHTKTSVRAATFAHHLGHKVILLTNSTICPIVSIAELTLLVPESKHQYTILPYITVVEALVQTIAQKHVPNSLQKLDEMDRILAIEGITDWTETS